MGTCTYTIAKTCGSGSTLPSFTVEAKNEIRGGNKHVAYVGLVTVRVYNTVISVARNEMGFVRVSLSGNHVYHLLWAFPISLFPLHCCPETSLLASKFFVTLTIFLVVRALHLTERISGGLQK